MARTHASARERRLTSYSVARSVRPPMRERVATPFRRHKDVLDNGLRVVTVELPHLHTASVVMYAKVGSRYEGDLATAAAGKVTRDNGLSHFLEHMLFRGTERLPDAYQLNRAIESIGGTLYAET